MSFVIAVCGMPGGGKSTVREFFQSKGYEYIHFGVTEKVMELYGETNEALERKVRTEMREKFGMAAMAMIAFYKIQYLHDANKNVVIDNVYSWSEYKFLKDKFGADFRTLAVHSSPEIRYERLRVRKERPLTHEEAISRDYSEIEELEKGGPIAMAEFHVINEGSKSELEEQMEKIYRRIMNYK